MNTLTMDMSSYELESEWNHSTGEGYSEEVLCTGWNPALALARQDGVAYTMPGTGRMPADLAALDKQQLAKKMYLYLSFE